MNILVFNCGSSSLTFKIFNSTVNGNLEVVLSGKAHRVGVKGSESSFIEYDNNCEEQVPYRLVGSTKSRHNNTGQVFYGKSSQSQILGD